MLLPCTPTCLLSLAMSGAGRWGGKLQLPSLKIWFYRTGENQLDPTTAAISSLCHYSAAFTSKFIGIASLLWHCLVMMFWKCSMHTHKPQLLPILYPHQSAHIFSRFLCIQNIHSNLCSSISIWHSFHKILVISLIKRRMPMIRRPATMSE